MILLKNAIFWWQSHEDFLESGFVKDETTEMRILKSLQFPFCLKHLNSNKIDFDRSTLEKGKKWYWKNLFSFRKVLDFWRENSNNSIFYIEIAFRYFDTKIKIIFLAPKFKVTSNVKGDVFLDFMTHDFLLFEYHFFSGSSLFLILSHCPIKKNDIMYVIFSKIESLVWWCLSLLSRCVWCRKVFWRLK